MAADFDSVPNGIEAATVSVRRVRGGWRRIECRESGFFRQQLEMRDLFAR